MPEGGDDFRAYKGFITKHQEALQPYFPGKNLYVVLAEDIGNKITALRAG